MRNTKKLIAALLVLACMTVFAGCAASDELNLTAVVEADIVSHYSEVSAKIMQSPIELGQEVKAGDIIAVLDDASQRYALEQMEQTLIKKQASLTELKKGADTAALKQAKNNITIAQQNLDTAKAAYDTALTDYQRYAALYEEAAVAQSVLDAAKTKRDSAKSAFDISNAQLDNAKQQFSILQEGASKEALTAAEADVAQTESQIRQMREQLTKYTIYATCDGTVISKNYAAGDIVAAGYNIADLSSAATRYVVAYLPTEDLPALEYGQEVTIRQGARQYTGVIRYIDVKSEYTPKDMQSSANKNKESVKIKAQITPDVPFKPGEKVEMILPK